MLLHKSVVKDRTVQYSTVQRSRVELNERCKRRKEKEKNIRRRRSQITAVIKKRNDKWAEPKRTNTIMIYSIYTTQHFLRTSQNLQVRHRWGHRNACQSLILYYSHSRRYRRRRKRWHRARARRWQFRYGAGRPICVRAGTGMSTSMRDSRLWYWTVEYNTIQYNTIQ